MNACGLLDDCGSTDTRYWNSRVLVYKYFFANKTTLSSKTLGGIHKTS